MTDEKDNAVELPRIAFIKAAMTIERDVQLHELTHDETNALVCAVLNTRSSQPSTPAGEDMLTDLRMSLEALVAGEASVDETECDILNLPEFRQSDAAEIARLREALEPFAAAAEDLDDAHKDNGHLWEAAAAAMSLTAGDLRRASAALGDPR